MVYVVGFAELSLSFIFLYLIVYTFRTISYLAVTVMSCFIFCNLLSSSHPINFPSYPGCTFSFIGVSPVYSAFLPYSTSSVANILPSSFLYVTVYFFTSYFAVNVVSAFIFTIVSLSILLSLESNHPINVYPSFSGVGNSPYGWLYVTFLVVVSSVASLPGLNVTVYSFAVQCAYNVTSSVGTTYLVFIFVPSVFSVYQTSNLYPSYSSVGNWK